MEAGVKVKYDPEVDILTILLSDAPVDESDETKPGSYWITTAPVLRSGSKS